MTATSRAALHTTKLLSKARWRATMTKRIIVASCARKDPPAPALPCHQSSSHVD